ncbi:protein ECERIFERUM 26-like [Canna indica]|uniref:Protein ECERIFERUM 26-like n=1 Tax=Canna indica TaxID=4628 RepID=A0AAQ3L159_9LILI|nr:protein ECERIFERUM 26-like [Canna indica]
MVPSLSDEAMGVELEKSAVYGHKFSTVVPAEATGDAVTRELTNMDLIMKLHYLRAVYYFKQSEVVDGLAITDLKEPMFPWLNVYYPVTGRIRTEAGSRPLIKCNDCGLRIIEAKCSRTLEEWLSVEDSSRWRPLVPEKVLGPELHFSPLVYIQFTRFKCGGMAIGYSWAHLLGDAVSATNCINLWGKFLKGNPSLETLRLSNHQKKAESPAKHVKAPQKPVPVKQVKLAGECWQAPDTCKMATCSFKIAETDLKKMQGEKQNHVPPFAMISALIWKCLAKNGNDRESKSATICRNSTSLKSSDMLTNNLKASTITLDSSAANIDLLELATLILKHELDELESIDELIDRNSGKPDFVLYGANLTFIDMEGIDLYGLELKGQTPVQVDYNIDGIGDEGAVLVLQGRGRTDLTGSIQERTVMVTLPEDQINQLRGVLSSEFGIA